jgi:hypothetical protein
MYRQDLHKSPQEVSPNRRVLLGTAAWIFRNIVKYYISSVKLDVCVFEPAS